MCMHETNNNLTCTFNRIHACTRIRVTYECMKENNKKNVHKIVFAFMHVAVDQRGLFTLKHLCLLIFRNNFISLKSSFMIKSIKTIDLYTGKIRI